MRTDRSDAHSAGGAPSARLRRSSGRGAHLRTLVRRPSSTIRSAISAAPVVVPLVGALLAAVVAFIWVVVLT